MSISRADLFRFSYPFALAGASTVALVMIPAQKASAVVITVGPTQFDITSLSSTYNASFETLQAQPWWNSSETAQSFASAYQAQVGPFSPLFAFTADPATVTYWATGLFFPFQSGEPVASTNNFAIATEVPIPGPLPILGAASAFAYSRKLRQRIRSSRTSPLISGPSSS